ncbi:MAG: carbamoyltransferase N-terminal domain-containing protein, partial [bacterium]
MSDNYVGVGGELHDSNVVVLDELGNVALAINEERLTRTKKEGRFPFNGIKVAGDNEAKVVIGANSIDEAVSQLTHQGFNIESHLPFLKRLEFYNEELDNIVSRIGHHESHAASAYYTSGLDESTVITMDGGSLFEPWCTTIYEGKEGRLSLIKREPLCFTDYYFFSTALLGFTPNRHEGKLTGLAAHGEVNDKLINFFEQKRKVKESLASRIVTWRDFDKKGLTPKLIVDQSEIRAYRKQFSHISDEDIAATVQHYTEELVLDYIQENIGDIARKNICL